MMTAADSSTDTVTMSQYQQNLNVAPSTPPVLSAPSTPNNNNKMQSNKNTQQHTVDFSSMGYRDNRVVHRPDSPSDEVTSTDPFEHLPSPISPSAVPNQFSYDDDRIQNDLLDEICSDIGIKDSMELDFFDFDDISNTGGFSDLEPSSTTNTDYMNKPQFAGQQPSSGQGGFQGYTNDPCGMGHSGDGQNAGLILDQQSSKQQGLQQTQHMPGMSKSQGQQSSAPMPGLTSHSSQANSVTSHQQNIHSNYVTSSCGERQDAHMYSPSHHASSYNQHRLTHSAPQSPRYMNRGADISAQPHTGYQYKPTSLQFHDNKPAHSQEQYIHQGGMPSPSIPHSTQTRPPSNLPPHMKTETLHPRNVSYCGKQETGGVRMLNSPVDLGYSSSDLASVSSYDSGKNSGSAKTQQCQGSMKLEQLSSFSGGYGGMPSSRSGSRENIVSSSEQLAPQNPQSYQNHHHHQQQQQHHQQHQHNSGAQPSTIVLSTPADLIQHMKRQYAPKPKPDPAGLQYSSLPSSPAKHMQSRQQMMGGYPQSGSMQGHVLQHQQQQRMSPSLDMNMRPGSVPQPQQQVANSVTRTHSPSLLHNSMTLPHQPQMQQQQSNGAAVHSQQMGAAGSAYSQQSCMQSAAYPQHQQSMMPNQMYPPNQQQAQQTQHNMSMDSQGQMQVRNTAHHMQQMPAQSQYGQSSEVLAAHSSLPLSHNNNMQQSHCHKILSKPTQGQRAEYSPYARNACSNNGMMQKQHDNMSMMHGMNPYGHQYAKRQRVAATVMPPPGSPHKGQTPAQPGLGMTGSLQINSDMSETQFDSQLEARLQQQLDQGLMGLDDDQVISYTQKTMFRPINPATMKSSASMRAMPMNNRQMMPNMNMSSNPSMSDFNPNLSGASCNVPNPTDTNMLRSGASSGEKMGFIQQLVTDRSSAFRSHPLFPLLRDLIIADMNFHTPTFPFQLISNLPGDFNRLLQNYLQRNPPAGNYQSNQAIENVMMDALRFAHQALIEKITAKKEQEQIMQPKPISAIEDFCARFDRAVRNSLHKGQVPQGSGSPGKVLIAPSRLSHSFQRPHGVLNPQRLFDPPDTCSESSVTSTRSAGSFGSETGVKKHPVLPKESVSVMLDWLREHEDNPYPNDDEKEMLIRRTKLTINQINYWFTNARRRILPKWREQKQAQARQASSVNSTPSKTTTVSEKAATDSEKVGESKTDSIIKSCEDDLKKTSDKNTTSIRAIHETVL